jgi:MFS family permease
MNPLLSAPAQEQHRATARDYLGVSLFWLALSFLWGALLTIALPAHIASLFPRNKDFALTLITASGAGVAGLSQIVFGALSDGSRSKFGRRGPFLFGGTLLAVGPLLLLPQAHTLVLFLLVYGLLQLTINIAGGPYGALMHDLIPTADHGTASAWIGVVGLIGRIGGPLVAAVILGRGLSERTDAASRAANTAQSGINFGVLLGAFAVVLVLVMLATLWLIREKPGQARPASLGQRLGDTFRVPLRPYPDFCWLVASRFGIMMGIYTVSNFLLYYTRDTLGFGENESVEVVKKLLVLSTITGLIGTFPSGALSRRIGRKKVLYGANAVCMISGLCFAFASNLTLAYIAAGAFGVGFGAFAAVDWALATGLLPPREPAKYMGVWGLSDTVAQVIAPLAAGPLALLLNRALGHGTGYRALMILAMVWFLVGTLALRPIREKGQEQ